MRTPIASKPFTKPVTKSVTKTFTKSVTSAVVVLATACVLAATSPAAPAQEGTRALIDRLIDGLDTPEAAERTAALASLRTMGPPACIRAVERLQRADRGGGLGAGARARLLDLLGSWNDPRAIEATIARLDDDDPLVARAASRSLLDRAPGEVDEALERALRGRLRGSEARDLARMVLESHLFERVEVAIRAQVPKDWSLGYFEGQFGILSETFGEDASRVVLTMFLEGEEYRYQLPVARENENVLDYYVGQALIEVASADMVPHLRTLYDPDDDESFRNEVVLNTLKRAGYPKPFDDKVADLRRRIEHEWGHKTQLLYDLARLYYRARMHREAIAQYNRIISHEHRPAIAYYNKACSLACLGRVDEAFATLRSAFMNGYDDLAWASDDGDLRPLHQDPRWEGFVRWAKGR